MSCLFLARDIEIARTALPARSVKKVSQKSSNTDFVVFLTLFRVIWDFFDTFLNSGPEGLGSPFRDFLGISGLGGVETPVYGGCNRNSSVHMEHSKSGVQKHSKSTLVGTFWPCPLGTPFF